MSLSKAKNQGSMWDEIAQNNNVFVANETKMDISLLGSKIKKLRDSEGLGTSEKDNFLSWLTSILDDQGLRNAEQIEYKTVLVLFLSCMSLESAESLHTVLSLKCVKNFKGWSKELLNIFAEMKNISGFNESASVFFEIEHTREKTVSIMHSMNNEKSTVDIAKSRSELRQYIGSKNTRQITREELTDLLESKYLIDTISIDYGILYVLLIACKTHKCVESLSKVLFLRSVENFTNWDTNLSLLIMQMKDVKGFDGIIKIFFAMHNARNAVLEIILSTRKAPKIQSYRDPEAVAEMIHFIETSSETTLMGKTGRVMRIARETANSAILEKYIEKCGLNIGGNWNQSSATDFILCCQSRGDIQLLRKFCSSSVIQDLAHQNFSVRRSIQIAYTKLHIDSEDYQQAAE